MNNKVVAIVINTSWNIYNFRLGLLYALQQEGYRIITISPTDEYSQKLEELGFEYHHIDISNKGTNPIEDLRLIGRFYRLYKKVKPDVLLHYTIKPNIYGTIAAKLANIPVISNITGLGTVFLNDKLSYRMARLLYKLTLKIPEKVFYQNNDDRLFFINSKLVAENKTELLAGSGIDTIRFSPTKNKNTNKDFCFLFIARLVKDKGLVEYVDAARFLKASYKNVHFKVLGAFYDGNPTAITPEEMAQWQQDNLIEYLGTHIDVTSLIMQADCVVLPSYREGLSRVLLEAASMAKPIVTTDVPGCRDVVDDGKNGFLCKVKDAKDLAIQMEKMILLGEEERIKMGKKGREKVIEEFDESFVINRYKAAIEGVFN